MRVHPRIALAAVAVVVLAVAIIVARGSGKDAPHARAPATKPPVVRAGLKLAPVPGWKAAEAVPPVPGLSFTDPIALQGPTPDARMLVGVLPATSPTLMPGDLTGRLRGPLGQPSKVQVKTGYKGFYYPGLAVKGLAAPLDLYLIPTTMGIVTAACVAAGDSGAPYYDCWKNLATLRLLDGLALRPGPDAAFRQRLPAEIATLDTVRDGARRELASRIPATQARGASRVAAAYERAAASLLPVVSHSSSWSRGVVAQLRAVGAAFRGVVDPLRSADAVRYARGRARAHARERRLERLIHDPESS